MPKLKYKYFDHIDPLHLVCRRGTRAAPLPCREANLASPWASLCGLTIFDQIFLPFLLDRNFRPLKVVISYKT